jgi:hypothetical protein
VDIPIVSDGIVEVSEDFFGQIETTAPRVTLDPAGTVITITDVGGKSSSPLYIYSRAPLFLRQLQVT